MGDKLVGRECFMASKVEIESLAIEHNLNQEEFEIFSISSTHSEQKVKLGATLPSRIIQEVWDILFEYKDIFSWTPHDLGTISRDIVEHRLGIPPDFSVSPTGIEFVYALKYYFPINNSESEYEALLSGLRMALAMNMDQLTTHGDSQIVYGHVTRTFEVREDNMKKYSTLARKFVSRFKRTYRILGIDSRIWLEPLIKKSIDKEILCIDPEDNWMTPIKNDILNGSLPDAVDQALKIRTTAAQYVFHNSQCGIQNSKTLKTQLGLSIGGNQVTIYLLGERLDSMEKVTKYAHMSKWHIQVIDHHYWFSHNNLGKVNIELRRVKQLQNSLHCTHAYPQHLNKPKGFDPHDHTSQMHD
ncbi:hypothetical protein M9H77_36732 [Catharanthus roseus]|uniref:Uncharacterized protein n=1 Tax=Catharanthus roseus TaxID=4058 RepID=A0ACB9ZUU6_CATRO|nr:hypothetical protein M9H77_36732 [Catharanthus roseus]